jgi:WD40 repeat protein
MPKTNRILLFVAVIAVAGVGLLAPWRARSSPNTPTLLTGEPSSPARAEDPLLPLTDVAVPYGPMSLAWSADGRYLAAGTWGRGGPGLPGERPTQSDVYVVDVAKASVAATLKTADFVESLAFSPDGKWLAVGCRVSASLPDRAEPAQLTVFAIPEFTSKFTSKARELGHAFVDLAWSSDSRSLYAIDGPTNAAEGKPQVRRWATPAFTEDERTAARATQTSAYTALAVSPDGRTLAVAETVRSKRQVRLFDLGDGAERLSFKAGDEILWTRLGFTPDGRAVGVLGRNELAWCDVKTGHPAKPGEARFARQPAGLSHFPAYDAMSLDGGWRARGEERHRGLGDLGFDNREKEFGSFVELTESATAKNRIWRVDKSSYSTPPVAFSPDGKKLAYAVGQPASGAIRILAVPK